MIWTKPILKCGPPAQSLPSQAGLAKMRNSIRLQLQTRLTPSPKRCQRLCATGSKALHVNEATGHDRLISQNRPSKVRFGSLADIWGLTGNVRSSLRSGHDERGCSQPKLTASESSEPLACSRRKVPVSAPEFPVPS